MTAEPAAFALPSQARILVGDVRAGLAMLDAESVQTCVTSVPYWGLRSYGTAPQVWGQMCCEHPHEWGAQERAPWTGKLATANSHTRRNNAFHASATRTSGQFCGHVHEWATVIKPAANGIVNSAMQGDTLSGKSNTRQPTASGLCDCGAWLGELGNEPTPDLYVEHIVEVFRHVWRVLRADGTLWLNIGFSYAGSGKGPTGHNGIGDQSQRQGFVGGLQRVGPQEHTIGAGRVPGYKPKDLIPIPWLVAIALQQDGWYWRSTVSWDKTACMPEAVTDRPTSAWEPILLMSKSRRYFYDKDAVMESTETSNTHSRGYGDGGAKEREKAVTMGEHVGWSASVRAILPTRNMRNVWLLGPEPYSGAHFAVFPTEVPRRCIMAGTSEKGQCSECGAPWKRRTKPTPQYAERLAHANDRGDWYTRAATVDKREDSTKHGKLEGGIVADYTTVGWQPSCAHVDEPTVPQLVLDPFAGAGTSLMVAARLGRESVGIELKPEYAAMAAERIRADGGFTVDVATEVVA